MDGSIPLLAPQIQFSLVNMSTFFGNMQFFIIKCLVSQIVSLDSIDCFFREKIQENPMIFMGKSMVSKVSGEDFPFFVNPLNHRFTIINHH